MASDKNRDEGEMHGHGARMGTRCTSTGRHKRAAATWVRRSRELEGAVRSEGDNEGDG